MKRPLVVKATDFREASHVNKPEASITGSEPDRYYKGNC